MVCNKKKHSVLGQLRFKNKPTGKETHRISDQICDCQKWWVSWGKGELTEGRQKVKTVQLQDKQVLWL